MKWWTYVAAYAALSFCSGFGGYCFLVDTVGMGDGRDIVEKAILCLRHDVIL